MTPWVRGLGPQATRSGPYNEAVRVLARCAGREFLAEREARMDVAPVHGAGERVRDADAA